MSLDRSWDARIVHPRDLSADDVALWRSFCESDGVLSHPFFSFAFARAVDRVHPDVFVAVLQRHGRTVGFLPFQFPGKLSKLLRAAERVGGEMADRFGIIAGDSLGIGAEELLNLARLNSLTYSFLPEEQCRGGLSAGRIAVGQHLVLNGDERSFWTTVKATSRKFATGIERKERVLERELGPLQVTFRAASTELSRVVEVKREQYRQTGRKDLFAAPWTVDLFEELLRTPDSHCTAVLSTLHAGETWLSSHLGVMSPLVFHHWFPVYNVAWARCSPGHILTKHLVMNALSAGVKFFDFGSYGDYKDFFGPEPYGYGAGFWHTAGLGGLLNQAATSLAWRAQSMKDSWIKR